VAFAVPENHASRPCFGSTASDSARPSATARRVTWLLPQLRLGCTRLVSSTTNDRESKSITSDVPVYPVCPAVRGPDRPFMKIRWSSSNPSPCERPGKAWL
jgi:hypothetical protein